MDMSIKEGSAFRIKGHRDGLIVQLNEGEWQPLLNGLLQHISDRKAFFKGARIALDVGNRHLSITEISSLRDQLSDLQVTLWALQTSDEHTLRSLRNLGLETALPSLKPEQKPQPFDTVISGEDAIFVRKTLRSGYRVVYEGHVVVIGDVNPGAEIIAGGSVLIWGRLRGSIHAGAEGDDTAVVCAMELKPMQMRIASHSAEITPAKRGKTQPEICLIRDGKVIIEVWRP